MGDFINEEYNISLQCLEGKFKEKRGNINKRKVKKFKYGKNDFNPHDRSNYDVFYKKNKV